MIKLLNGDCLELMKSIPDGSIDAIITDPPYGTTACKWDSVIPFEPMWAELKRIIKPNGAIVLFGSEPFSSALRMSNIKQYKYDWIWEKQKASNFMNMNNQPGKYHEIISVFSYNKHYYFPIMWKQDEDKIDKRKTINQPEYSKDIHYGKVKGSRKKDTGMRFPKSVLKFDRLVNSNVHPTQKPVALIEYLIKTYTQEGETVLDFTAGSFTTAVACENTNRKWICIEKDEGYCQIGAKRINENRIKLGLDILDFTSILEK